MYLRSKTKNYRTPILKDVEMKCLSCNATLSDVESTLVFEHGEHIDLCLNCLETTEILAFQGNLENLINEDEYHVE